MRHIMTSIKKFLFRSKRDVDMTEGSIIRHLILFALPLLIGNIFQQLYNTVDTWVVGNYVSNEAFRIEPLLVTPAVAAPMLLVFLIHLLVKYREPPKGSQQKKSSSAGTGSGQPNQSNNEKNNPNPGGT